MAFFFLCDMAGFPKLFFSNDLDAVLLELFLMVTLAHYDAQPCQQNVGAAHQAFKSPRNTLNKIPDGLKRRMSGVQNRNKIEKKGGGSIKYLILS